MPDEPERHRTHFRDRQALLDALAVVGYARLADEIVAPPGGPETASRRGWWASPRSPAPARSRLNKPTPLSPDATALFTTVPFV